LAKLSVDWLEDPPKYDDSQSECSKRPPHARLPDEVDDELPVHTANDRSLIYIGCNLK